ncbi:hypothetical protein [uncultured Maritimibacter sp.]|uniref:hypothetical protein n=1 Tax=uncultured Maritimibacter sp. TaxID=991866 RepID=UPI002598E205|nr:hypothetical protein [uncultured Maritimibacter sp.]
MNALKAFSIISVLIAPTAAFATDCTAWRSFVASEDYLKPLSLSPSEVAVVLNASEYSSGLEVSTELRGQELWLDITLFPGDAPAVAGTAAIMKVGRLVDADFDALVLSDDGTPIFSISEPVSRELGCQFIWGREGGENPIHLMRILMKNLMRYETGKPVATGFTGSLLGDTNLALQINNEVLVPEWAFSSIR